jgi:hypothetical protein
LALAGVTPRRIVGSAARPAEPFARSRSLAPLVIGFPAKTKNNPKNGRCCPHNAR